MKEVLKSNGDSNKYSSKRVVSFLLTLALLSVVVANTFFDYAVEEFIFDGLVNVLIWSLGFVGSEQFAGALKKRYEQPQSPR